MNLLDNFKACSLLCVIVMGFNESFTLLGFQDFFLMDQHANLLIFECRFSLIVGNKCALVAPCSTVSQAGCKRRIHKSKSSLDGR